MMRQLRLMARRIPRSRGPRPGRSEVGDTLIEVLLALVVLGLASVALLIAFGTTISASSDHRGLATSETALVSASSEVSSGIQQNASALFACPTPSITIFRSDVSFTAVPSTFTATLESPVLYWNGSAFASTCVAGAPQELTFQVKNNANGDIYTNTIVVDDPLTPTVSNPNSAYQLLFITEPAGAVVGDAFTTQPEVEILDAQGNVVTNDLSPMTIEITPGTGTSGAVMSNCTATPNSGTDIFAGCTINELGIGYQLTALDPGLISATSSPFNVTNVLLDAPTITSVNPSTTTAGAITVSFNGSANAPIGQLYTVTVCNNASMAASGGSNVCFTQTNYASGGQITGLTVGTNYYADVTAVASTGYVAATTPIAGPTLPTAQLTTPGTPTVAYGSTAGSIVVTYTGSSNAPGGQTYSVEACTNAAMTLSCTTDSSLASGGTLTGLAYTPGTAGGAFYVEETANASTGFLVSAPSAPSAPHADTSQMATPTGLTAVSSTTTSGAVTVNFTASTGTPPANYTAVVCTNSAMTTGCVTETPYTSGTLITGLTPGTNYYATVTANTPSTAYVSATTSPSLAALATVQLSVPSTPVLAYGASAGSITVTSTSSNAPVGQTYNVEACTNAGMTTGCVTNGTFTSGGTLTGLAYTVGSAGGTYYVEVTATASTGYLASAPSAQSSHADTSQVGVPGTPTVASSGTAGNVIATFSAPSGTAPASYSVEACTNAGMSTGCVTQNGYTSGAQITGLTQGSSYYVQITANPPTGYVSNLSNVSASSALATTQLAVPSTPTLAYGASAGSINVTSTSSNAAVGQTYTVEACTNAAMSTGCVTNSTFTSGNDLTGLAYVVGSAGGTYYVEVTANASTGYLASTISGQASHADTSQIGVPGTPTVASSGTAGNIIATFSAPSGTAPASYSVQACTNAGMTSGCVTQTGYTSGAQITGLTPGSGYYVQITANPPAGYVSNVSLVSASSALATTQLGTPVITTLLPSTTTAGQITIAFNNSSPAAPSQSYTAEACTNPAMSSGCVTHAGYVSGTQFTGLTAGTNYYVTISAVATTGYLAATTADDGPVLATVQLGTPGTPTLTYGASAGSLVVTFTASSPAAPSQSYTAVACTNAGMTTGCSTNTNFTSGGTITGLTYVAGSAGTTYYVEVTAVASSGYLVSAPSGQTSHADTSQIGPPGTPTVASSITTAGAVTATFTASTPAASSYTAVACTNAGMTNGCVTQAAYTSGSQITGLSQGANYWVQITANPPAGYVSNVSAVSLSSAPATTQIGTSTINPQPSTTTAGQITITFSNFPNSAAGQSYTAKACTNAGMTSGCVSQTNYTSGSQMTGLTAGTNYYVTISAVASAGYLAGTTADDGPVLATVQLATPSTPVLAYGASAGSITVTSTSSGAPGGQTYTVVACTNAGMTTGCVTNSSFTSGGTLTGLAYTAGSAGGTYYVEVTANASSGYLVSATSAQSSHADTSQLEAPGTPTVATGTGTGHITVTFTSSGGTAPSSYTAEACTNAGMTTGCVTHTTYTSGSQFTGLVSGTSYWADVTAVPPAGYVLAVSATSTTSAAAS
jgi:predicted secreted protein